VTRIGDPMRVVITTLAVFGSETTFTEVAAQCNPTGDYLCRRMELIRL
jgi:hypothetical protein